MSRSSTAFIETPDGFREWLTKQLGECKWIVARASKRRRSNAQPFRAWHSGGGTGPTGKTCRECKHWQCAGYYATSGLLKNSPCGKYTSMMNGVVGAAVPHYAPSCKYFDEMPLGHPIENPKRR